MSAISVGLALDGERYMGVVYNPYLNELFTAVKGQGAYLNGVPIHVWKMVWYCLAPRLTMRN